MRVELKPKSACFQSPTLNHYITPMANLYIYHGCGGYTLFKFPVSVLLGINTVKWEVAGHGSHQIKNERDYVHSKFHKELFCFCFPHFFMA